jgi:hypothetical protein
MRTVIGIIAFMGLVSGIGAQDDKPSEKYVSKDGKYTAAFPGKPTPKSMKVGDVDLHCAILQKGEGVFSVFFTDVKQIAGKLTKPKEILDGGQKGVVANFKAKLISSKDFDFGKQKYPARELVAEKDGNTLRFQIILAGNRLYQVFVVGPKDMVMGKEADDFLKSFEITK